MLSAYINILTCVNLTDIINVRGYIYKGGDYINIYDIARGTGYSIATVSRVINKSNKVKSSTKKTILEYMEKHDYIPSEIARSLSTKKSNNIGLIVPDIRNEFFPGVYKGISGYLKNSNLNVILIDTDENPKNEAKCLRIVKEQQLVGLIISPVNETNEETISSLIELRKMNVPIVLLDRDIENVKFDGVFIDNNSGAKKATQALIDSGHRKIAVISGPETTIPGRERLNGFIETLNSSGININKDYIKIGDFKKEKAYYLTHELMKLPKPPTAIFSTNNLATLGILKCFSELNLTIGRDISIVGFDDIGTLSDINFGISVIDRPVEEMGRIAIKLLLNRLEDTLSESANRVILNSNLILRGSEKLL